MHVMVRVWLARRIGLAMLVSVVLVVNVLVRVRHRLVSMCMLVPLRQVKPHAERHEPTGQPECRNGQLPENHQR